MSRCALQASSLKAQLEMVDATPEAAQHSPAVVGLEQGDQSYAAVPEKKRVLFAAPSVAGIQSVVAEDVIMRTGVGRQSKEVKLPGHERAQTVVILMSVVRIVQVVSIMIRDADDTSWVTREAGRSEWRF
ncbi:hypothetical protein AZE42_09911 [Rhizopogon vesiculosus]|uniref:Uncharacterized protein n=1 Tax=Rhizopogon vesiculosus TaxID=180088 RepID=A0A1J8QS81_9AGAM|nr:hypothetical protein AZE42_09911 [Rhizopogon vesiculosus]